MCTTCLRLFFHVNCECKTKSSLLSMKKLASIPLFLAICSICVISCKKEEEKPSSLDLSAYTGLFYCNFKSYSSFSTLDSGYRYIRVKQKNDVWGTLIITTLGTDSNSTTGTSYEADFAGPVTFSRLYPRTGCSHCRYTTAVNIEYKSADSASFIVGGRSDQPVFVDYTDSYTGKRVK